MQSVKKDARLSAFGSGLLASLDIAYASLVRVFGVPNKGESGDQKVACEWILRTPDGVATIYNYKSGKNYLGASGLDVEEIRDWHIGGRNSAVVGWVRSTLGI